MGDANDDEAMQVLEAGIRLVVRKSGAEAASSIASGSCLQQWVAAVINHEVILMSSSEPAKAVQGREVPDWRTTHYP